MSIDKNIDPFKDRNASSVNKKEEDPSFQNSGSAKTALYFLAKAAAGEFEMQTRGRSREMKIVIPIFSDNSGPLSPIPEEKNF